MVKGETKKSTREIRPYRIDFKPEAGGGGTIIYTEENACTLFTSAINGPIPVPVFSLNCSGKVVFSARTVDIACIADAKHFRVQNEKFEEWCEDNLTSKVLKPGG